MFVQDLLPLQGFPKNKQSKSDGQLPFTATDRKKNKGKKKDMGNNSSSIPTWNSA